MADDGAHHVKKVEEVIAAERDHLRRIRGWRFAGHGPGGPPLLGLALSGGGIRSCAFAIGVLHALVRDGKLRWFDYLSTVSGGGYAGGALTWMLSSHAGADVEPGDARGPGGFPLGGWRQGRRTTTHNPPARFDARPFRRLDWIRLRANYLTPTDEFNARERAAKREARAAPAGPKAGPPPARRDQLPRGGLGIASVIGVVLRSAVIGLLTYMPAILVLMLALAGLVTALDPVIEGWWPGWKRTAAPLTCEPGNCSPWEGVFVLLAAASLALFVAGCLAYALVTRVNQLWAYPIRTRVQWLGGHVLTAAAFGAVMATLPYAPAGAKRVMAVAGLTAGGVAAGALRLLLRSNGGGKSAWSAGTIAIAGGLALCYGLLLGTHILAYELHDAMRATGPVEGVAGWINRNPALTVALTLAWAAFAGLTLNLNYVTPHRMYRDRLMEALMPAPPEPRAGFEAHAPDRAPLADMCGAGAGNGEYPGPYHLINANVVLTGSRYEGARGRGGDSFLLSPLFCGAHRMGWYRTQSLGSAARLRMNRWTMTMATAVSISGAAANPNTGAGGRGPTRLWPIAFLMNLLHLRLGYVEVNPRWVDRLTGGWERWLLPTRPNGWLPGLPHLLGLGHHEEALFVELSDGGHFENLGLYELFRRETRVIVCSDAGCDGGFAFFDLANAIERARIDFGVNIRFAGDRGLTSLVLPPLRPDENAFLAACAERGFAVAAIRYAPTRRPAPPLDNEPVDAPPAANGAPGAEAAARTGILVYVKSTMVAGLPADLYGYRAAFPEFPHQTTADQWFDEPQFESYRELGYQLMSRALADGIVRKVLGDPGAAPPAAGPDADRMIAEALELAERPPA